MAIAFVSFNPNQTTKQGKGGPRSDVSNRFWSYVYQHIESRGPSLYRVFKIDQCANYHLQQVFDTIHRG